MVGVNLNPSSGPGGRSSGLIELSVFWSSVLNSCGASDYIEWGHRPRR